MNAADEPRRHVWFAAATTFALLAAYSLRQSPVPGVNEPQYLGKALHFWDPAFCPGDFFLDSSDPHGVFSLLVGPVAARFGLTAAAYAGRAAGLGLLAAGWVLLARRVVGSAWAGPLGAAGFLAAAAAGNLSGEWLVGGAEGKVFAYGFLMLAADRWLGGRAKSAAVAAGLAISFHPVVGVWGVLCGLFAAAWGDGGKRVRVPRVPVAAGGWFAGTAAPGLWFALAALDAGGADAGRAHFVQVYRRLPHHLDPMTFRTPAWVGFAHLALAWAVLRRYAATAAAEPAFALAVLGSLLVAYAGVLVGLRPGDPLDAPLRDGRVWLLKFYPFRLADVLVPAAAAFTLAGLAARFGGKAGGAALLAAAYAAALLVPFYDRDPSGLSAGDAAAWRAMCGRVDAELPADALVITPPRNHAFKWYARRAEYVAYKDCPQDPAGILEWDRRLAVLNGWARARHLDDPLPGYDTADLAELRTLTGATHLLTGTPGPVRRKSTIRVGRWRLYELPE